MNLMRLPSLSRVRRSPGASCCLVLLLATLSVSSLPLQATPAATTNQASQRFITIDFNNVDIHLFIKYISELTGKNFIVDKAVQGNVTIISPTKISEDEAYQLFESVLEVNGFATVPAGSAIKILPASRALTQNTSTIRHGEPSPPEDKIVTQLIPLRYTTPEEMKKVLAPLVSKTSVVIAHTQSGMLIVTETLSNIQKLLTIIDSLDVPLSDEEIEVIPLRYASASVAATSINALFPQSGAAAKTAQNTTLKVVAYEPNNSIILVASPMHSARVKRLLAMMDTEMKQNEGNIHVVYLQHATAKELATVLTALPGQQSSDPAHKGEMPAISKDVKIMPDTETNSLIITASRAEFRELENVIRKLDIPRRMVYLEALIMEVDADSTFNVGVNWLGVGNYDSGDGHILTGFGGTGGSSLSGVIGSKLGDSGGLSASSDPTIGAGFSIGVLHQGIEIGGVTFPNIAAILKAYKGDSHVNVIATPQILTTDNKKAEISVGENVPYLTRTQAAIDSTTGSSGLTNDYQSIGYQNYEYKDIATKLTITPQINQADILRLEITTEVSKLKDGSESDKPTTFKRTATTTVLVKDNNTIVIGGIIGQDETESENKVPLLGDIPGIGWLFKEKNKRVMKTNMFIFITPRIIKNPGDMEGVTSIKTDAVEKFMPEVRQLLENPMNNNNAMNLIDRGFEQMQRERYAEARESFNQALKIAPQNPYAQFNLGVISERENKPDQAIKHYQIILDNAAAQASINPASARDLDEGLMSACRENIARLQRAQPPSEDAFDRQL